jgi:hypothetical protein
MESWDFSIFFSLGGFNKLPIPHMAPTIVNDIAMIAIMLLSNIVNTDYTK